MLGAFGASDDDISSRFLLLEEILETALKLFALAGSMIDSDLWRARAGSVSARPAVRRLPAAASCSLPGRAAACGA